MTQQKSENRIVPEARGNSGQIQGVESPGGGKAIPVKSMVRQLTLPFATAENPKGPVTKKGKGQPNPRNVVEPKANVNCRKSQPATLNGVISQLTSALQQVVSNDGAPGPDGQTTSQLNNQWAKVLPKLSSALSKGRYRVGDIRRVNIPKPGGGERGLGIPNVIDRVVQEAVRQVLEPVYEPMFHENSYGFRPGRSCHMAIAKAVKYMEAGYEWVVDLDLEKFFDLVSHQRLMSKLAQRISDRPLLVLIGQMLKAKVLLPDGVLVATEEGMPQGGPLSPLLSNIVLDEFDWELDQRRHRFVRYADDCNIFVRSERAGQRVMASISKFIEGRLRLKVNTKKSAVARPEDRQFLGFTLRRNSWSGKVEILLSAKTRKRAMARILEETPRGWGNSLKRCISKVNAFLNGWYGYFKICSKGSKRVLRNLDAHIRRRLRAIQLKHWKRKRTIVHKLIRLGVGRRLAWRRVYEGRKSLWALSYDYVAHVGLRNAYFAERGLVSLEDLHHQTILDNKAPKQLLLPGID